MIVRIVLLKLRERGARDEVARASAALRDAPEVRALRVGRPADAGSEVWDVLLELSFDGLAAAEAFPVGAVWQAFAARTGSVVEVQKSWNFAVD